MKMEMADGPK